MKPTKIILWSFALMVAIAALYRIIPGRPPGFAPQWAMALFAGAVIKDRKWALAVPVFSLLISDALYEVLYINNWSTIPGFYQGQWINYLLFGTVTFFGFQIRKSSISQVFILSLVAPTYFFLVSNFLTWAGVGEYVEYPKSFSGLLSCYAAGLPFYKYSLMATLLFSSILFGSYRIVSKNTRILKAA